MLDLVVFRGCIEGEKDVVVGGWLICDGRQDNLHLGSLLIDEASHCGFPLMLVVRVIDQVQFRLERRVDTIPFQGHSRVG